MRTLTEIRADMEATKHVIDDAYWTFTRTARGKPPHLTVPGPIERMSVLGFELTAVQNAETWEQRAKYMLQAEARRADCIGCGHIVWQFRADSVLGDGNGGFMPVENRKYNDDVTLHDCADQGVFDVI